MYFFYFHYTAINHVIPSFFPSSCNFLEPSSGKIPYSTYSPFARSPVHILSFLLIADKVRVVAHLELGYRVEVVLHKPIIY